MNGLNDEERCLKMFRVEQAQKKSPWNRTTFHKVVSSVQHKLLELRRCHAVKHESLAGIRDWHDEAQLKSSIKSHFNPSYGGRYFITAHERNLNVYWCSHRISHFVDFWFGFVVFIHVKMNQIGLISGFLRFAYSLILLLCLDLLDIWLLTWHSRYET